MKRTLIALFLMTQSLYALADGQSDCDAAAGSYVTGTVVSGPKFARASSTLQGVKLSHTHVRVQSDQDGQVYDVAIDNVYADDYALNSNSVPKSLRAIRLNDKLELCGQLYTSGGVGIHWVHDNCNVTPDSAHPDGWIKETSSNGDVGDNLAGSQAYCYLWN
ncbi:hypothetical protein AAKU55_002350 [Oxalobacteraceae bacterium GrIS 1.11]